MHRITAWAPVGLDKVWIPGHHEGLENTGQRRAKDLSPEFPPKYFYSTEAFEDQTLSEERHFSPAIDMEKVDVTCEPRGVVELLHQWAKNNNFKT